MASDITKVSITATTPQTAQYLYDLIVAARTAASQMPLKFASARRITFRVPTAAGGDVFIIAEPKAGLEGMKILPEEEIKEDSGSVISVNSVLSKYVYASVNPTILEITSEY